MADESVLIPDWPAPASVRAVSTTRLGGFSAGAYASLNLALHVGDEQLAVNANRERLLGVVNLPGAPVWLDQCHGTRVLDLDVELRKTPGHEAAGREADAAIARTPGLVCAVLTADCLPVLLTDAQGSCVAAVHAGWRGLAAGVIEAAVLALGGPPGELLAWLGPCIGRTAFEIGPEVRDALLAADPAAGDCFEAGRGDRWHADLQALARRRLVALGVSSITASGLCTYSDPQRFFSHRRDGPCGRMATLIWREFI